VICQRNATKQTNKFPLWPFWDKNHLTGFKNTFPVQK
jgi:hypothetical protein